MLFTKEYSKEDAKWDNEDAHDHLVENKVNGRPGVVRSALFCFFTIQYFVTNILNLYILVFNGQ